MKKILIAIAVTLTLTATAQAGFEQVIVCTDDNRGCQIVTVFTDD